MVTLSTFQVSGKCSLWTCRSPASVQRLRVPEWDRLESLMWDLMSPAAGIWQAAGATAGLQRPPMRNWSDSHSRVNHFHKLITFEERRGRKSIMAETRRRLCRVRHRGLLRGNVSPRRRLDERSCSAIRAVYWLFQLWIKASRRCIWIGLCIIKALMWLRYSTSSAPTWLSSMRRSCLITNRKQNKSAFVLPRATSSALSQFTHRLWLDLCILIKPRVNSNLL